MKTLMLAGYETTSVSLTWALVELSLHPEIQDRLRKELLEFENGGDASYDQLMNELPYLDAMAHHDFAQILTLIVMCGKNYKGVYNACYYSWVDYKPTVRLVTLIMKAIINDNPFERS